MTDQPETEANESAEPVSDYAKRLVKMRSQISSKDRFKITGKLSRIIGLTLEAVGVRAPIGSYCLVETAKGKTIKAEVVGFADERTYLMPINPTHGLLPGAKIEPTDKVAEVAVGPSLLGRVIDGSGTPLDDLGVIATDDFMPLYNEPINPLIRKQINEPIDVGVQSINALLTIGRGQRMGLFAGSGVGKSVLLSMMARYTSADVIIVGLIGERGREVKDFIENDLGAHGLQRSVVVASPADTSPLMRLHAAMRAMSIAEYFRDQGKQVLLLMDSVTRFAQAQREIGLAIGEPPATKGYPPSVFAKLPHLIERAGNATSGGGSITAFYTVFVEGDDIQDPIADSARAVLDGHIVLSREIAETGLYPAIDIERSISRLQPQITTKEHQAAVQWFKGLYARYQQSKDLISIGAYSSGSDPEIDLAITQMPFMQEFLRQGMHEQVLMNDSMNKLMQLVGNAASQANQRFVS